jgi:hypothetical protein
MKTRILDWLKTQHQEGDCFWILRDKDQEILEISEIDQLGLDQDQADDLFDWRNDYSCRTDKWSYDTKIRGENERIKINLDNPSDKDILLYSIAYTITNRRETTQYKIEEKNYNRNRFIDYGKGTLYSINRCDSEIMDDELLWRLDDDESDEGKPYKDYYFDWCRREGKEIPDEIGYEDLDRWFRDALYEDNKEHPDYAIQEEMYNRVADSFDEMWLDQSIYTETMDEEWDLDIEGSIQFDEPSIGDMIKLDYELYVITKTDGEGFWEAIQPCMNKAILKLVPTSFSFSGFSEDVFYWKFSDCDDLMEFLTQQKA